LTGAPEPAYDLTANRFVVEGWTVGKVVPFRKRDGQEEPARREMAGQPLSSIVDEVFADAVARGLMDDLPGKGKPFAPEFFREDPFRDEHALEQQMLREAGILPEWVKLRKQISAELAWVRANRPADGEPTRLVGDDPVYRVDWAGKVAELNQKIRRFNLICPPTFQIPFYKPEYDR
jgi:hypothetical protein